MRKVTCTTRFNSDVKFINTVAAICIICALALSGCASSGPTSEDATARQQLTVLEALTPVSQPVEDWLPLSLAAIQTGDAEPKVWATGRSKVPARPGQIAMRVASISKLAVAYGAMALVERDVLDLDEDVSTYLGWSLRHPDYPDAAITARHLLSHQASLVDGRSYQAELPTTLQDMMADERFYLAGKSPGQHFTYSNIGYGVLATVMEAASGKRFDLLMDELVFTPAGLDIGFNWHGVSLSRQAQALPIGRFGTKLGSNAGKPVISIETLEEPENSEETLVEKEEGAEDSGEDAAQDEGDDVIIIAVDGDPIAPQPTRLVLTTYVPGTNATIFSPQGGLRASITDVARLGELLRTNGKIGGKRVLESATVKRMLKAQWTLNDDQSNGDPYGGLMTAYGLGVQIYEPNQECFETKRRRYYGHFGEAYGLLGGVLVDKKEDRVSAYLMPYTPDGVSKYLSDCSGLYVWEEQFLKTAFAP